MEDQQPNGEDTFIDELITTESSSVISIPQFDPEVDITPEQWEHIRTHQLTVNTNMFVAENVCFLSPKQFPTPESAGITERNDDGVLHQESRTLITVQQQLWESDLLGHTTPVDSRHFINGLRENLEHLFILFPQSMSKLRLAPETYQLLFTMQDSFKEKISLQLCMTNSVLLQHIYFLSRYKILCIQTMNGSNIKEFLKP